MEDASAVWLVKEVFARCFVFETDKEGAESFQARRRSSCISVRKNAGGEREST